MCPNFMPGRKGAYLGGRRRTLPRLQRSKNFHNRVGLVGSEKLLEGPRPGIWLGVTEGNGKSENGNSRSLPHIL